MNLVKATDEQTAARDRSTYSAWGVPLTMAQWQERERRLRMHPMMRDKLVLWLLVDDAGRVLSSCETVPVSSFAMRGNRRQQGVSHGVASVFTEPALRGKNYATELLKRVIEQLRNTDSSVQMAFLFSDVGDQIYQRVGFVLRPSFEWLFRPIPGDPLEGIDRIFNEEALSKEISHLKRPADCIYLWPSAVQLDWHLERERIYSEFLKAERPWGCGAAVGESFIVWAGLLRTKELVILLLQADELASAEKLLWCASRVAHRTGLDRVRWWECPLPFAPPPNFAGGDRLPREKEQPMALPLANGIEAAKWNWIPRAVWL